MKIEEINNHFKNIGFSLAAEAANDFTKASGDMEKIFKKLPKKVRRELRVGHGQFSFFTRLALRFPIIFKIHGFFKKS